jgi:hypothetical protein
MKTVPFRLSASKPIAGFLALVFLLLGLTPGCTLLRFGKSKPEESPAQKGLIDEQIQLQRFTDDFLARGGQALDESAERLGTDAGRGQVLRLKLTLGSSVIAVVSGPNPNANLLDMVSLTVLTRLSVQDYWMKTTNGAAFQPWLDASLVLETNIWDLARRFLQPAQIDELRRGIEEWYAQTPEVRTAFFARPQAFAYMVRSTQEKGEKKGSVFSLVSLDPMAGLEPAVREVTQSRLFAERAMYTTQRLPFVLRLQVEMMGYEIGEQPAVRLVLTNSTQLSDSAQRFSRATESLSQSIAQLPDHLATERKEFLAAFDAREGELRELVAGTDHALVSGEKMSDSLNISITNFNNLMKRFGVGEPATHTPPGTNTRPFNILDYATTADEIDKMAKDVNVLVSSVGQTTPEIARLRQQADAEAHNIVNHTFWVGLVLIAALLVGAVLAGLLYTSLAQKLRQRGVGKA